MAVIIGVLILVIPIVIGVLSASWQAAVALAGIPVLLAMILDAGNVLTPTLSFTRSRNIPVSHFGSPFWLDSAHIIPIVLALALFGLLAWFGWVARQATE
jgi:hypothetical protein